MKQYVQYFTTTDDGRFVEALASDGYKPYDGRLSVASIIELERTQGNFRNYTHYQIHRGNFKHSRVVYSNF